VNCPVYVQRLGGIWAALAKQNQASLLLLAQQAGAWPLSQSQRGDQRLRRHLYQRAVGSPLFAQRLAELLAERYCRVRGRPTPEQVLTLLRQRPGAGLILGLLWGMGEEIQDPDWQRVWNDWLRETVRWRQRMEGYDRYADDTETLEIAETLVSEAERQRNELADEFRTVLRAVAVACRRRMQVLSDELEQLRAENLRLRAELAQRQSAPQPLEGRTVLVVGDPSRASGYRDLMSRYGAEAVFCDGQSTQDARRVLKSRYDAVLLVSAWTAHAVQNLVRKHRPAPLLVFVNRCGLGEMERVVTEELLPAFSRDSVRGESA